MFGSPSGSSSVSTSESDTESYGPLSGSTTTDSFLDTDSSESCNTEDERARQSLTVRLKNS